MDLENLPLYEYTPLASPTSIRLVRRLETETDGVIRINLEEIDLKDPLKGRYYTKEEPGMGQPAFHCLSYTWGNPYARGTKFEANYRSLDKEYGEDNLFSIICNGKRMKIRRNLYDFFRQAPKDWYRYCRSLKDPETGKIMLHDDATRHPAELHRHVSEGDRVDTRDLKGRTPLHYAAYGGLVENVQILLKGGAGIDMKDLDGKTAEDLARENNHEILALALKNCMLSGIDTFTKYVPPFIHEGPDAYVWIDAVCIDQNNLEERASQIQIMHQIYTAAHYVTVWLGAHDKHIDDAIATISKLSNNAKKFADSDLTPFRTANREAYDSLSMPYISQNEWDSLAALFLRQWFRRMWIVQEAACALGIVMYCGTTEVSWDELKIVTSILTTKARKHGDYTSKIYVPRDDIAINIEHYFTSIEEVKNIIRKLSVTPREKMEAVFSQRSLLGRFIPFQCADPRDKIYALLPLSTYHPSRKMTIYPDYRVSAAECYARYMKFLITDFKNLVPLSFVHDASRKQLVGLPSWVPDFSLSGVDPLFSEAYDSTDNAGIEVMLFDDSSWNELHIHAMLLDEITATAAPRLLGGPNTKFTLDASWFELLRTLPKPSNSGIGQQSRGEILWRTLCTDINFQTGERAPIGFGAMFTIFVCAILCSEPEFGIRARYSRAVRLGGLMSTAAKFCAGDDIRAEDQSHIRLRGCGTQTDNKRVTIVNNSEGSTTKAARTQAVLYGEPDKDTIAKISQELAAPHRNIQSHYFDSSRTALKLISSLVEEGDEPFLPTIKDVETYLSSGTKPLKEAGGYTFLPPEIKEFLLSYHAAYSGRRLFTTKTGYLGLGPCSLEVGDTVWLVPGLSLPIILRAYQGNGSLTQHHYRFVGACYLHGVMREERSRHFNKSQLEKIILI